jgi:hypothetical protein
MKYYPLLGLVLITGCAGVEEPRPTVTEVNEETIITSTASVSHTLVLDRNTDFMTCTTPSPDATFSQGADGTASVNVGVQAEKAGFGESLTENGLGGRTPAVLMTRELFFRSCEFSRNYNLTKAEAYQLYLKTLAAATAGWAKEAAQTTVNIGETETVTTVPLVVPNPT